MKKPHPSSLIALACGAAVVIAAGVAFYRQVQTAQQAPAAAPAAAAAHMTDSKARELCMGEVQARLAFPSSFSMTYGSAAVAPHKSGNGDRLVRFSFTAKNGLGVVVPQSAECIVKAADGFTTATLTNR